VNEPLRPFVLLSYCPFVVATSCLRVFVVLHLFVLEVLLEAPGSRAFEAQNLRALEVSRLGVVLHVYSCYSTVPCLAYVSSSI
jgi:hypothetical protein